MKRQLCQQCNRPLTVCFCHCLHDIDNEQLVWIFQHYAEKKHAIGTAKIAQLSLKNIVSFSDDNEESSEVFRSSVAKASPVIVYPGEEGIDISQLNTGKKDENKLDKNRPILFLDGSWRKTRKMFYQYPELLQLPRLTIQPDSSSRYRIRKEPEESSVSTLEAIVYVLSRLENNTEKYQPLLEAMDWMINRQIEFMGDDVYRSNYKK